MSAIIAYCRKCGSETDIRDKYCNYCGHAMQEMNTTMPEKETTRKALKLPLAFVIFFVGIAAIILHIIFADLPFSFIVKEKVIDQEILKSSVVNIWCESDEGGLSGSGTIITTNGLVITNSHVIPQNEEFLLTRDEGCWVILPNQTTGQPEEIYWANPIVYPGLSDEYDLAYLEIYETYADEEGYQWGAYPKSFPSIFADENQYDSVCQYKTHKLGDPLRVYGYPSMSGGNSLTITDGIISSFSDDGHIFTSAKIDAGNSGGLAVDHTGCMIGIPVAVREGVYQNLGVIIPMDKVIEFFEQ